MDIKLLVMDVDGTLTDGKVYMGASGELVKCFDIKDGYGIANLLPKYGIVPAIITGRKSEILLRRCEELKIFHVYQGISEKTEKMEELMRKLDVTPEQVAYIGDDLNDLDCMKAAGVTGCPADAVKDIKEYVDFVSTLPGGSGAVREFIEWLGAQNERKV